MGWAIRRVDGTYRYWSRYDKILGIEPGETWEERESMPDITSSLADQAKDDVRDAYVAAKAAMVTFEATSTLANAKPALLKLGLCVEELLKYLNKRIA